MLNMRYWVKSKNGNYDKNKNYLTLRPKQRFALKAFVYVVPHSGLFLESINAMFANRTSASN